MSEPWSSRSFVAASSIRTCASGTWPCAWSKMCGPYSKRVEGCYFGVRKVLRRTETHYLLNRIFLDDYCVWVQHVEDETFARVAVE
eukprot:21938-Eustigmatos_ZCMA.PRE.1